MPLAPSFVNLIDVEALARDRLPPAVYDYFAGGANDEITVAQNRRGYEELALRPRVLVDVSRCDTRVRLLGSEQPTPFVVAPMALQRMAHLEGEGATARAAAAIGAGMAISTLASMSVEEICRAAARPPWFQLYIHRDRGITRALVERAAAAGCGALLLTVDTPVLGRRERDVRNAFLPPATATIANIVSSAQSATIAAAAEGSALAAHFAGMHDPSVTWRDLEWLQSISALPLVLKGVVRADDARRAVGHGAKGIVVSNHGGRQLDSTIATVRALPEVAEAVAGAADVLVDGGVRRGTDVVKALALGAKGVLIGRPVLWGLAVDGEAGAVRVLTLLKEELELAMALCGCAAISDVTRDLVAWP